MKNPLFSIIIPTLNEEKFLPQLLQSLVSQTDKNFEVIILDGKSKDKTVEVAKAFAKKVPHLQVIVSKKASLPLQRNLGAKEAQGEWLVFVDADSVLLPHAVERLVLYINDHDPSLFTTWFTPDSREVKDAMFMLLSNLYLEATLQFKRPTPPGPLSIIRKDLFFSVGGYDEEHAYNEDVDLGLRLHKQGIPFSILRETLCVWSLRRYRREGTLRVMQQYVLSVIPIIFLGKAVKRMPGYIMGGQMYGKKKISKRPSMKEFEKKLKIFLREMFS